MRFKLNPQAAELDNFFLSGEKGYCKISGAAVRLTGGVTRKILIQKRAPPRAVFKIFTGGRRSADRNVS